MATLIQYVEQFLAVLTRIAVALETIAKDVEPPERTPIPVPAPAPVIPAPPAMPTTTEKVILRDDFSTVPDIPDPATVPDGTTYHWAAGNTEKATTTIQWLRAIKVAVLALVGVTSAIQQGARAFFVTNGRWDALTPYFRHWIRIQVDFYLRDAWKATGGAGMFTTLPWEVKRKSDETASVQVNIDENGKFWLKLPFGSGDRAFYAPSMPPVNVGWNHLELRLLLDDREDTGRAELEFEGVVIKGTGAVSNADGTSALALTLYSNAVDALSVPVTNVLISEMPAA